jgi:hypothetical protein
MWISALGDACDLCHEGETDAILYGQKLDTSMLTIIRTVLSDFRCLFVPSLSSIFTDATAWHCKRINPTACMGRTHRPLAYIGGRWH